LEARGPVLRDCSCDVPCPCTVSLDFGADRGRCNAFLVFEVEAGEVDGVDVGGLTVAAMIDTPKVMSEGNWRFGMLIDDRASDEQAEKLGAVFGGQLGGPMEALGPLIGERVWPPTACSSSSAPSTQRSWHGTRRAVT
jgi:hypothetical protein